MFFIEVFFGSLNIKSTIIGQPLIGLDSLTKGGGPLRFELFQVMLYQWMLGSVMF